MDPVYFCLVWSPLIQNRWVDDGYDPGKTYWAIMMSTDNANEAIGNAESFMEDSDCKGCVVVYFCPEDGAGIIWRDGMTMHDGLAALQASDIFVSLLCLELAKRSLLIRDVYMSASQMFNYRR